jgi:phospholipid/cholesterol/gamma-HCH transport system substrate-binding protein
MAGVTLGRVTDIKFDEINFQAVVTMKLEQQYNKLPLETTANIYTAGLLGEKYIGLQPGSFMDPCKEEELNAELEGRKADISSLECGPQHLTQGSKIIKTQGSLVLEELIAKFVSQMGSGDKKAK